MRDILVTLIVFGLLPSVLRSPVNGVLMWVWISVMNPHTQGWGFATEFPFAHIIALTTIFSMLFTHEPRGLPRSTVTAALLAFTAWMCVTLPFSMFLDQSLLMWWKVMKIMLMTFVCFMLVKSERDIHRLAWVLAISLGFYGVKGGIFTLRSGGSYRVWGPDGTFIADNNALALALIMVIPLMVFLRQHSARRWLRHGLFAAMLLTALAALGAYSRGALLAIGAMAAVLWMKSRNRGAMGAWLVLATPLLLAAMPQEWTSRMESINDYQQDSSAQGRINAWGMAWNLARDRPFGGGFDVYEGPVFAMYAPNPTDLHAAHSIYFQVLGEHGFVGLALYLLLGVLAWRTAGWIIRHATAIDDLRWAASLAAMIQTSLAGFAVGGAFLSLAYFDVPYYLVGILVATRALVERRLAEAPP
ncbi:MAG TPA: putative O-glycosylation ligase, exosortase A system-associated [Telluria sp.]|nr:putative O-glycosylation ligase, exosortase A system-associated [Telluria sp.]